MGRWNFLCALVFWVLTMPDISPLQMAGVLALVYVACVLDHVAIQKDSDLLPNQNKSIALPIALLYAIIGLGIFAGEKDWGSTPIAD